MPSINAQRMAEMRQLLESVGEFAWHDVCLLLCLCHSVPLSSSDPSMSLSFKHIHTYIHNNILHFNFGVQWFDELQQRLAHSQVLVFTDAIKTNTIADAQQRWCNRSIHIILDDDEARKSALRPTDVQVCVCTRAYMHGGGV